MGTDQSAALNRNSLIELGSQAPAPKGYHVIPALLDRIVELAFDPRVAAFFGVCLGLYILRDVARICLRLMEAFWRGLKKKSDA